MHDVEEDGFAPPPPRRWKWYGVAVECSKLPVGLTYAVLVLADCMHHAVSEIHSDMVSHYNWSRGQDLFRESVTRDLEMIREG